MPLEIPGQQGHKASEIDAKLTRKAPRPDCRHPTRVAAKGRRPGGVTGIAFCGIFGEFCVYFRCLVTMSALDLEGDTKIAPNKRDAAIWLKSSQCWDEILPDWDNIIPELG